MLNKQRDIMHTLGYLTVGEVAEKVGRTEVTVYQWVEEGKVASRRLGRSVYVERKSLLAYLGADNAALLGFI
jgi:excisionase family DNA binding protein